MYLHPRDKVRTQIETALKADLTLADNRIIAGGQYSSTVEETPNVLIFLAGEAPTNLYNNACENSYNRAVNVHVVISVVNGDRLVAIGEAENIAREIENSLLSPNSKALSDLIIEIRLSGFEPMEPVQGSASHKIELIFAVTYSDFFV